LRQLATFTRVVAIKKINGLWSAASARRFSFAAHSSVSSAASRYAQKAARTRCTPKADEFSILLILFIATTLLNTKDFKLLMSYSVLPDKLRAMIGSRRLGVGNEEST
jgi:hypothetical protein